MLKVERTSVMNLDNAIRGARNPMNSWAKSDSYYDESGMFRYRSEDNYAYLAPGSNSFTVYRQAATPYTTDMSVGRSYYFHGHFMPYNDIDMKNHLSRLMNQY